MKNKTGLAFVIVFVLASMLACNITIGSGNQSAGFVKGSGNVVEETREVSNVSGIELSMSGTLHLSVGDSESLRIKAEDNLLPYIESNTSLGKLVIKSQDGIDMQPTRPIDYYLTVIKLDSIAISSSGDVEAGDLVSGSFSIAINSSGDLTISSLQCSSLQVRTSSSGDTSIGQLNADSIDVKISSSGNLEIQNGTAPSQDIEISSSGEYKASDMQGTTAQVTLSSSGNATVRVSDQITGRLSSSGDLYYIGSPAVNVTSSSSGKVIQISP